MRLIDADALKDKCYITVRGTTIGRNNYVMFHEIDDAPTIDAVQVVRCKDCIYYETCNLRSSHWWKGGYTVDIEFCSFGERREEVNGFKSVGQAWNTSQERRPK